MKFSAKFKLYNTIPEIFKTHSSNSVEADPFVEYLTYLRLSKPFCNIMGLNLPGV